MNYVRKASNDNKTNNKEYAIAARKTEKYVVKRITDNCYLTRDIGESTRQ